jgi:UDPglucose 6-dehydrogenase
VEESQGVAIARQLANRGHEVSVYDPVATEPARKYLDGAVQYAASIADCIRGASVVIIATDWPEFRSVFYQTANATPRPLIIDGWRMLRSTRGLDAVSYWGVGLGHPQREMRDRLRHFVEELARSIPVSEQTEKGPRSVAAGS